MNNRERLGIILRLFGLYDVERRLYRFEVGLAESRERSRIRVRAALIPAAVWTAVLLYCGAVVLAQLGREQQAGDSYHQQPVPAGR